MQSETWRMNDARPVDPLQESRGVTQPYHNRSIATANDHEIRMSVMTHGFPWHRHPDSDETFLCLDGELVIEFDDGEVAWHPASCSPCRLESGTARVPEPSGRST